MKISTTWSQKDWNDALKKVWQLSRDFNEILTFGLENDFITSKDIIEASNMYQDPNKEYSDDEVKEMISSRGLRDIMGIIQEDNSLDDILDELPKDDLLDCYEDDDLLYHLEGTWSLDSHDSEVREEYDRDLREEITDDIIRIHKNYSNNLHDYDIDGLHRFICNYLGIGYYDQEGLIKGLNKLKEELNQNTYNIKY